MTQSRMKRGRRRAGALGQLVTAVERRRQLCAQQEVSESASESSSEAEGGQGAGADSAADAAGLGSPKAHRRRPSSEGDTQRLLAKTSVSLQGSAGERGQRQPAVGDPITVGSDATEGEAAVRRELAEERAKITQRRSLPEAFSGAPPVTQWPPLRPAPAAHAPTPARQSGGCRTACRRAPLMRSSARG